MARRMAGAALDVQTRMRLALNLKIGKLRTRGLAAIGAEARALIRVLEREAGPIRRKDHATGALIEALALV